MAMTKGEGATGRTASGNAGLTPTDAGQAPTDAVEPAPTDAVGPGAPAAQPEPDPRDPGLRRLAGAEGGYGKALGIRDDWAVRAITAGVPRHTTA